LLSGQLSRGLPILATAAALSVHYFYFTLIVGGDHFEYRIYNHLFPLVFLCLIWAVQRLALRPVATLVVALLCVLLSLPVPWTHWYLTKDLSTRVQTHKLRAKVSPVWPTYLRWYTLKYDVAQEFLIFRMVCCRHQEHKVFATFRAGELPSREEGRKMDPTGFPVYVTASVGMAGWVMPNACIIDALALTDYVAARTPMPKGKPRRMAHDRMAPPEYLKDFRPNVTYDASGLHVAEREPPLTERDITEIETKWWEWAKTKAKADK
jgi:arabinofuranosyltransferase